MASSDEVKIRRKLDRAAVHDEVAEMHKLGEKSCRASTLMTSVYGTNAKYDPLVQAAGGVRGLPKLTGSLELVPPQAEGDSEVRVGSGKVTLRPRGNILGDHLRLGKLLKVTEHAAMEKWTAKMARVQV